MTDLFLALIATTAAGLFAVGAWAAAEMERDDG